MRVVDQLRAKAAQLSAEAASYRDAGNHSLALTGLSAAIALDAAAVALERHDNWIAAEQRKART